jgi:hypothetical protein
MNGEQGADWLKTILVDSDTVHSNKEKKSVFFSQGVSLGYRKPGTVPKIAY